MNDIVIGLGFCMALVSAVGVILSVLGAIGAGLFGFSIDTEATIMIFIISLLVLTAWYTGTVWGKWEPDKESE